MKVVRLASVSAFNSTTIPVQCLSIFATHSLADIDTLTPPPPPTPTQHTHTRTHAHTHHICTHNAVNVIFSQCAASILSCSAFATTLGSAGAAHVHVLLITSSARHRHIKPLHTKPRTGMELLPVKYVLMACFVPNTLSHPTHQPSSFANTHTHICTHAHTHTHARLGLPRVSP
jgi:hypothetical protein